MKKILSILGTISLIGTSTTSLVACNNKTKIHEYTPEELTKLKEANKINTTNQEIKDKLEWIVPQEKPFNTVDNKYYFVIWKTDNWNITKFRNNEKIKQEKILKQNGKYYELKLKNFNSTNYEVDLFDIDHRKGILPITRWITDNGTNFKAVYRWNGDDEPNTDVKNQLKSYLDL